VEQISKKFMNWASIIDEATMEQAKLTSTMPFIFPHLALMPDAHLGKGATVGSVIPTLGAIIPAAVGVDLGCGIIAVRTQFTVEDLERPGLRQALREVIEARVPMSAGKYNAYLTASARGRIEVLERAALSGTYGGHRFDPSSYAGNWREQLGTLGSGNHFIEVSADQEDRIWLFLHSGSRGIGNKIAQHHITVAQELAKKWWIDLPHPDLAYLVQGTPEFSAYVAELQWAQAFALANREEMMDRVLAAFSEVVTQSNTSDAVIEEMRVNCHHNYTSWERHFGKQVIVSRKGAIDASEGTWGLIPGSMGDKSYVVVGKGNQLALNSAPHGAGRVLSRSAARRTFTSEQLHDWMAAAGTEYRDTDAFIDEHPMAYKRIDLVMADAADLVDVRFELRALINCKGD